MHAHRSLVTASLLVLAGASIIAQQSTSGQNAQPPTFRTGTEAVTIDVAVVDKEGVPLRGLTAADFTVNVAGQPRRILSVEYVDTTKAPQSIVAKADIDRISTNEGAGVGRLVAFVVDQSSLEAGSVRQISGAASKFLDRLTFADRSALWLMPIGQNIQFTWNHGRVRDALGRVAGLASLSQEFQYGSISDARDLASRNPAAMRGIIDRECGNSTFADGGFTGGGTGGPAPTTGGGTGGQTGGGTTNPGGGSGQTGGGGTGGTTGGGGSSGGGSRAGSGQRGFGNDRCTRGLQMEAEMMWRQVQMTSYASLTSLRQVLNTLAQVRGDKTLVLISGGMPLDERENLSMLSTVASEAAAARTTLFTVFIPAPPSTASRSRMLMNSTLDQQLSRWSLDTLAGMTGGASYRADIGAVATFDRLSRELSGYYRLGVEKNLIDTDRKTQRLKVQVARSGMTVRARELFDVRTFEDRNWTARLADALVSPVPATGVGVRMTSYLAADPEGSGQLTLMLAGEVSRLKPGPATYQVAVRDIEGGEVVSTEQPLGDVATDRLPFSANLPVKAGSYIVRFAVMDSTGRVGSVDHRVEARRVPVGSMSASGPLLVRIPNSQVMPSGLSLDGVRQDERLALQVDLEGEDGRPADTEVVFEIASAADGPALMTTAGEISGGPTNRMLLAQAIADVRVLPPGQYFVRAKVKSGSTPLGELRRGFSVLEPTAPAAMANAAIDGGSATESMTAVPAVATMTARGPAGIGVAVTGPAGTVATTTTGASAVMATHTAATVKARAVGTVKAFGVDQVLAPTVIGGYLDQLAARPDAASPAARALLERARSSGFDKLVVADTLASEAPVAAPFVKGLTLLAQGKLDPAAQEFRSAMRAGSDFYPAMVYLGACLAAGGKDKEAAGAWRTALIREGDSVNVHLLLSDALLRSGRGDLAMQALTRARERWPSDDALTRRYAAAAIANGLYADGLKVVDDLVERKTDDEPVLALGLLVLYDAFVTGRPVDSIDRDRAQMARFAGAYRARGGPSLALVDAWMAAAAKRGQ